VTPLQISRLWWPQSSTNHYWQKVSWIKEVGPTFAALMMVKAYQIEKTHLLHISQKTVSHFASHCKILELWVLEAWYGHNLQRTKPLQEGSFNFQYLLHKIQSAIQFKETVCYRYHPE
jgi:hypothetical protein